MKLLLAFVTMACFLTLNAEEEKKKAESKPEAKAESKSEAKAESKPEAKAAEVAESKADGVFPEKETYTKEEVQALREVLVKKSTQLDQDIDAEKKYAESLKQQVVDHLAKIEAARNQIAEFMSQKDQREEGKLKKLAKFYESMDAEQAAPLLKEVPDDMAIKIFDRMDAKKAGSILALLPASRAAKLTQAFPRLKISEKSPGGGDN